MIPNKFLLAEPLGKGKACGVEVFQELLLLGLSARLQEPAPAVVVTHILPVPQPKSKINHRMDLISIVVFMTGRPVHKGSTLSSMNMTPMKYQSKITALS